MKTTLLRRGGGFSSTRETAPAMWLVEALWYVLATGIQTNNRFSLLEQMMGGGLGPPSHRHPLNIENFYVLEGQLTFHVQGREIPAGPGSFVHIPRMAPHTFTVDSEETRVLNFYVPAGPELHIVSLARPADERRRPMMEEGPPPANLIENEILSRIYGSNSVAGLPFSVPPSPDRLGSQNDVWTIGKVYWTDPVRCPSYSAFGIQWRELASSRHTEYTYDMFDALLSPQARMPARLLGADEALYVIEGCIVISLDGDTFQLTTGGFVYAPAGSLCGWIPEGGPARTLVFHVPGGFDRALSESGGDEALVAAWQEASGTRFLEALPLPDASVPRERST